ncbi:MAG: aminoacetone oxidase family FAD-binding enzyme [Candidatus Omnitrophota bacterium]
MSMATKHYDVAIVGGGAAGITAAISAARKGNSVVICEKMPGIGKKLLISGSGRCNLYNEKLGESYYNPAARPLVRSVLSRFGKEEIEDFFGDLGLKIYYEDGRAFPFTNQSSSVLKVLEMELKNLGTVTELNFDAKGIADSGADLIITSKDGKGVSCRSLVIAGGGKTYPALGSDGGSYRLAERFGHTVLDPVPSAVPLVAKDKIIHLLQGQKVSALARGVIGGSAVVEADGEVLFTRYGLSGTAILDISRNISIAMNRERKREVSVSLDLVPFMSKEDLEKELDKRRRRDVVDEELLAGLLPNKFGRALKDIISGEETGRAAGTLKDLRFRILGTRGWNEAEFTAGGIDTREVIGSTLGSMMKKGLYFAGEVLDVDGVRGGYNLAWAWASGFVAGLTE